MKPLFDSLEWDMPTIKKTWDVIERIAKEKYDLDFYPAQIEIISADQMLEAYSAHAMPVFYDHWSFGVGAEKLKREYDANMANLAYEVVINTNPCISYLMENNDMVMQTLVLAHAAVGHSSFFKTNYMFKEHTNANSILDYLRYAKMYVSECEKTYGLTEVEDLISYCHQLQYLSVDRYPRKHVSDASRSKMAREMAQNRDEMYNPLYDTFLSTKVNRKRKHRRKFIPDHALPEDNLLYFIEKYSPKLETWEREIVRIVRKVSQYFYPQILTKTMNEGTASFWHYTLMNDLCDEGYLTEGHRLQFLQFHTSVLNQRAYSAQLNPYTIGFNIFNDIRRICEHPTAEDREYMPNLIGRNWVDAVKEATAEYKDSSFIANCLSPKVVRDLGLFILHDEPGEREYVVEQTHDKADFVELRRILADKYEWDNMFPSLQVVGYNPLAMSIKIKYTDYKNRAINGNTWGDTKSSIEYLTGCTVADFK